MISSRLPADLSPNRLARAVEAQRRAGRPLIDLTISNPTRAGLARPPDLLEALADPAALDYDPQPLGLPAARAAVARDYARRTLSVDPDRVTLTASTSEAYALLFKLFCDPGDAVLIPQPSYPLFEHLATLEAVTVAPYRLVYDGTWRVDLDSVRRALSPRARALVVVSPNNPTGSWLHADDLAALADICAGHALALIGDEVFADYPLDPAPGATSVLAQDTVLTCALGGLSKSAGLPQVKLGWIAWTGPAGAVTAALRAFEVAADALLSVSTPVQVAAPRLLDRAEPFRAAVQARLRRNLDALRRAAAQEPAIDVLPTEGGWSAVLRLPALRTEEDLVVTLVEQDGVLAHPGFFFDFDREAFVIVSLLAAADEFDEGVARLFARATQAP